ncbi:TPA: hypothetical protein MMJ71_004781 [Salmonella enterica subsp. enterica serovar Typhimurium]|nr:hypothetical protein [Salmonella enterica subsp. enterica serovar Typhimurium]
MEFNPELVKALAQGDDAAYEEIKSLPVEVRMALGIEIDKLRREESIVPMDGGKMSLYVKQKSKYQDDNEVGNTLATMIQREKDASTLQEKIRQEHIEKEVKYKVSRARAGLTY